MLLVCLLSVIFVFSFVFCFCFVCFLTSCERYMVSSGREKEGRRTPRCPRVLNDRMYQSLSVVIHQTNYKFTSTPYRPIGAGVIGNRKMLLLEHVRDVTPRIMCPSWQVQRVILRQIFFFFHYHSEEINHSLLFDTVTFYVACIKLFPFILYSCLAN